MNCDQESNSGISLLVFCFSSVVLNGFEHSLDVRILGFIIVLESFDIAFLVGAGASSPCGKGKSALRSACELGDFGGGFNGGAELERVDY